MAKELLLRTSDHSANGTQDLRKSASSSAASSWIAGESAGLDYPSSASPSRARRNADKGLRYDVAFRMPCLLGTGRLRPSAWT